MRIRFIYIYREKETGSAVYTGSAFDVGARDIQHCKGLLAFDKEIQRKGRDAFTLEIVEAFRTETVEELWKTSAARENQWMAVLGTYRTSSCFNFSRASAVYDSQERFAAARIAISSGLRKRYEDPKARLRVSEGIRKYYEDPKAKAAASARNSVNLSAYFKTPEGREVHAAAMRKRNSDPLERAKQSVKAKAIWTPERREAWSIKMRGLLNSRAKPRKKRSPEARLCHSEAAKLYFQTEEGRASHSAAMKKRFSDPAERERQRATAKATWTPEKRLAWGVRMRAVKSHSENKQALQATEAQTEGREIAVE